MADLEISVDEHVAVVTLNRPEKANALTDEMFTGLAAFYAEAAGRPDVRVVVLTGAEVPSGKPRRSASGSSH
jgi:enoyl-CoA hydratase